MPFTYLQMLGFITLGVVAGSMSGLVGIGGGIILVPAMVFFCGFTAHMAQGTSLALMLPPIGILAVMNYYQKGFVNVPAAIIIAIGFVAGGYFGSKIALGLPDIVVRRIFATLLIAVALKMFLQKA